MVRALTHWKRVELLERPGGWCHRVLINACRSWWRRRRVEARYLSRQRGHEQTTPGPSTETMVFWSAVRNLPTRPRTAFVLYYAAERSLTEVAAILGVPEGTVGSDLSRARRRARTRARGVTMDEHTPDTEGDGEDRIDALARRSAIELRRSAPSDGPERIRRTARARQRTRTLGTIGGVAGLLLGALAVTRHVTRDDLVKVTPPTTSTTTSTNASVTTNAPPPTTLSTETSAVTAVPPPTTAPPPITASPPATTGGRAPDRTIALSDPRGNLGEQASILFTPDNRSILWGWKVTDEVNYTLYDAQSGGASAATRSAAISAARTFSPDGATYFTGTELLDGQTLEDLADAGSLPFAAPGSIAKFSPDGRWLVYLDMAADLVAIDVGALKLQWAWPAASITRSTPGGRLQSIVFDAASTAVWITETATGPERAFDLATGGEIPSGSRPASTSAKPAGFLTRPELTEGLDQGSECRLLSACATISPDGSQFASVVLTGQGDPVEIRVWDYATVAGA